MTNLYVWPLTVHLAVRQSFGEIDDGLADEVRLPLVVRIAGDSHRLATLDIRHRTLLGRRRRRLVIPRGSAREHILGVLDELESQFLIPLWMLPTAPEGPGASSLAPKPDRAVWVLLANVPLVR